MLHHSYYDELLLSARFILNLLEQKIQVWSQGVISSTCKQPFALLSSCTWIAYYLSFAQTILYAMLSNYVVAILSKNDLSPVPFSKDLHDAQNISAKIPSFAFVI